MQSWISKSTVRSVSEEPESMQMAAENRRRIMGSSLFGGDSAQPQQQNLSSTAPIPAIEEEYTSMPPQSLQNAFASTLPPSSNIDYGNLSSTYGRSTVSDFPNLDLDTEPPPIISSSDLGFKPKQSSYRSGASRRLQVPPNQQMRQLRDELNRETERFNQKLRQIGQF